MSRDSEIEEIKKRKLKELMNKIKREKVRDKPVDIQTSTFTDIIRNNKFVLIDCWATWCGPCKLLSPIIDELARKYSGRFLFAKLNVDENVDIASRFGINAIPTLLFFVNGELVHREVGALSKEHIEYILQRLLQRYEG